MPIINNLNIKSIIPLEPPAKTKRRLPLEAKIEKKVLEARKTLENILLRKESRHILIVGPCSIHNADAAMEYALKLEALRERVADKLFIVMRVYFEKPRTTVGWKGMIYDPDLNGTYNIERGLFKARKLLLDVLEQTHLPIATEFLDPIIPQYIADLISWAAIGARTTESQTHRQLASGLSMPVGFKNATDGGIDVAIDAIKAASSNHSFLGVIEDGMTGIVNTKGNAFCHLVLRGGNRNPNYSSEHIAFTRELMKKDGLIPNIMVDCSHANSKKQPAKQKDVMQDVILQIKNGEKDIIGTMLESYLKTGNQQIGNGDNLDPAVSVTDACLGWDESVSLIQEMYASL